MARLAQRTASRRFIRVDISMAPLTDQPPADPAAPSSETRTSSGGT